VTHENLLNFVVCDQSLLNWSNLLILKSIFQQVQISQWKEIEKISERFSTNFVIVNINIAKIALVL